VTIGLIAVGVVAFLALDAIILWKIFGGGNRVAAYGSIPAPGQTTLNLPAGPVRVTYQESRRAPDRGSEVLPDFPVPEGLEVSLSSAAGEVPIEARWMRQSTQAVPSWFPGGPYSRVTVGHAEIPADGFYTVEVSGGGSGPHPKVLLGR
jgi:hypothetical protein